MHGEDQDNGGNAPFYQEDSPMNAVHAPVAWLHWQSKFDRIELLGIFNVN